VKRRKVDRKNHEMWKAYVERDGMPLVGVILDVYQ
jgi:hypothetical protein